MLNDAEAYDSHRGIQLRDASEFVESVVKTQMDWSHEEQDVVMDVGCGPGGPLRDIFVPRFPRVKKFIGVDIKKEYIAFARENHAGEKIEFHVADMEDRQTVERWFGQVTKVISIYCLNWLKDIEKGFENIYHLLKPRGEAAMLICIGACFWTSSDMLFNNPKYSKYLQKGNCHVPEEYFRERRNEGYFRRVLENMGFEVVICDITERTYTHASDEDSKAFWYPVSGMSNNIPDHLKEEFIEDMFEAVMKYSTRTPDGKPVSHYTRLTLLVRKKCPPT